MFKIVTKGILRFTKKYKNIIMKIVPIEFLRKIKRELTTRATQKDILRMKWVFNRSKHPDGINYIGFIQGEIGLGQSCRLIASAIDAAHIDFTVYNFEQISAIRHNDHSWDHKITNTTPYNINLFHLNPPELSLSFLTLGKGLWKDKYNIAYWLWELEDFPQDWLPSLNLVDEIWTPADFITENIQKITDKPVRTLTYPLVISTSSEYDRAYFELPEEQFLFLTMYDCNSTIERKNPIGAIEAFKRAFKPTDRHVGLVIKVNNPQAKDLKMINERLQGYSNVYLIAKTISKLEVNSLIEVCDVLVSLHRAEGYGLPMAEAMAVGTPVIGTNWSANTEFMNRDNSCLVSFELIELQEDYAMYKKGSYWADPNIADAADYMVKLVSDKDFYKNISQNALKYIKQNNSVDVAAKAILKRIDEIYQLEVKK